MYLRYGSDPCPICGKKHLIPETPRARRLALQVMMELSETGQRIITGGKTQRFMVGVLISGNTVLVSRSGSKTGSMNKVKKPLGRLGIRADNGTLQNYNVTVAGHVKPPYRSIGGCAIDLAKFEEMRPPGNHPDMGICAAPHLVMEARKSGLITANCSLSEIWYHPNTQKRTIAINAGSDIVSATRERFLCGGRIPPVSPSMR